MVKPLKFICTEITFLFLFVAIFASGALAGQKGDELDIRVHRIIEGINVDNLRGTILRLQGFQNRITFENQWETARWIGKKLEELGVEVEIQTYGYEGRSWPNVVATMRGNRLPDEVIMPIAHIDTKAYNPQKIAPGADDDGSGVAVLIEMARVLRDVPLERTVIFCFFSNEETDLAGSSYFAKRAAMNFMDIKAVINVDDVGYNDPEDILTIDAFRAQYPFVRKLKTVAKMLINFYLSYFEGGGTVKVAGRNADSEMVKETSRLVERFSRLKVKEEIGDHCA